MTMLFLRITVVFILLLKPLYYSPQKPDILYCNELIRIGDKSGLKAVEGLINPLALLYLDTAYASHIIDWEFRQGFLKGHPDSASYYVLDLPEYTLDIAMLINNMHAVSKLLSYYVSIPRITKSDTIYRMYGQLYRLLPVFISRKSSCPMLEVKLRKNFSEWERLSAITPPVRYTDPSVEFDRFLNLKPLNSRIDPRYMELILGLALQQLGSPGFGEEKIKELRKIQTCLGNKRFQLPKLRIESMIFTEPIEKRVIHLMKSCRNISELLADNASVTLLVSSWLSLHNFGRHMPYSHSRFLVMPPNKAYIEIYYESGMQSVRLSLLSSNLIRIEKLSETTD